MSAEAIFSILNAVALVAWILLAVLPRRRWVPMMTGTIVPAGLAVIYIVLILLNWQSDGGFSSLAAVSTLFGNPFVLLAGWTHYLAFDLFVGTWEARDAQSRGVPHVLVLPCLALTFLFGPAGWLLYLAVRRLKG